jgi:hypothetical protein
MHLEIYPFLQDFQFIRIQVFEVFPRDPLDLNIGTHSYKLPLSAALLCPKGSCKFCFPFHLTWEFIISAFFF